ncbi:hypothetical protein LCGC14_0365070 [marine sediment metagenome]|uniref:Uncharacterized protein n=1 Tax=marine sediment metagenome TaxID=412755 RepID=A0A0F9T713_9ZZZZ
MQILKTELVKSYRCHFWKYQNGYIECVCNSLNIIVGAFKTKKETLREIKRMINKENK